MELTFIHVQPLAGFSLPVFQDVTIHPPEPQRMDVLLCLPGPLLCSHAGLPGFGRESLTVQWLAAVADAHSHGVLSAAESCFLSHACAVHVCSCTSVRMLVGSIITGPTLGRRSVWKIEEGLVNLLAFH